MAAKYPKYSQEALEAVAKRLSSRLPPMIGGLKIESSRMVTVLDRRDRYRKEGLLGGERFSFSSVYAGKSGKLIFCFKPSRPVDYKQIEVGQHEIEQVFPSVIEAVEELLETDLGTYLKEYSQVYEEKEMARELAEKKETYGSNWGMF